MLLSYISSILTTIWLSTRHSNGDETLNIISKSSDTRKNRIKKNGSSILHNFSESHLKKKRKLIIKKKIFQ